MPHHPELLLSSNPLSWHELEETFDRPFQVSIEPSAWEKVETAARWVEEAIHSGRAHYGINTGFGALKNKRIPSDQLAKLQRNLILSHAVGVGEPAHDRVVRWMLLFKIHSLLAGHSGIRAETVRLMAAMINHDCLPVIPSKGSLGASGDLAPLAHMVLPMLGEGQVRLCGVIQSSDAALESLDLEPIALQPKEGLALINGTQYMSAVAAQAIIRARRLAKHADVVGAMSLEACRGSLTPFEARLHKLRPHAGAVTVAKNFRTLLHGSEILKSHADCDKVQDPYSLRCSAAVHGASRDAIEHAASTTLTEINSVTDNPILFGGDCVVSGGNFHGQPLALVLEYLTLAVAELANISERRTYLLMSGPDELPALLVKETGVNSGLMMLQYTAAALVNENKVLASPAVVDSIPTSLGQEDHVSMGATCANKLLTVLDNAETVLGIELICAAQGLDHRLPLKPGKPLARAHELVRSRIPHTDQDRCFQNDLEQAVDLLRSTELLSIAGSV